MKVNRVLAFFVFIFVVGGFNSVAQNTDNKPLVDVLVALEKQYNIVFTYADNNIQNILISLPKRKLSLDEHILVIESQTNLSFKKINSRYIAIKYQLKEIYLRGTIVDKNSGKPIKGTVVDIGKHKTVSNSNGEFSLKIKAQNEVLCIFSHKQYHTLKQRLNVIKNKTITIKLTPIILDAQKDVVIPIKKHDKKILDKALQLDLSKRMLFPGLSEPDILKAVQVLPGIHSINETVSDINIRGGGSEQSLVLWDGGKMYQTSHFFGQVSAFNSNLVEDVQVIKAGTSAIYGEGSGGIIDLQLEDSLSKKFEAEVGINMISADAIVKIPLSKKITLIAGGRHSINNIFKSPTYENYFESAFSNTHVEQKHQLEDTIVDDNLQYSFYDASFQFLFDISKKDKLRISALKTMNSLQFDEFAMIMDSLHKEKSHLKLASLLSNIKYARTWNERHQTELSAFISSYNIDSKKVLLIENQDHIQKNEVIDWGVKLDSKSEIKKHLKLNYGYHFKEVSISNKDNLQTPSYNRDDISTLKSHSLYSEGEFNNVFDKMDIRTGIRANYFTKVNELSIEPRFILNFKINKHISIETSAEKKSQCAVQIIDSQSDFFGVNKQRWVLSDGEDIPVIESHQFTIGAKYALNDFLFRVDGYFKNVAGIVSYSQGFQNQFQFEYSKGEFNSQGLEVLVNKSIKKANLWFNYAMAKSNYYFKEFKPSYFPSNNDIKHSLTFGGNYSIKSFEFSSGLKFNTGKPFTQPAQENLRGQHIVYQSPNSSRIEDFIRIDVSAKYKFKIKKVKGEIAVSVWNLLNRKNVIDIYYQQNENRKIEEIKQYALGFTPNVSLRFWF